LYFVGGLVAKVLLWGFWDFVPLMVLPLDDRVTLRNLRSVLARVFWMFSVQRESVAEVFNGCWEIRRLSWLVVGRTKDLVSTSMMEVSRQ
jgi:hypothetical protein